MSKARDLGNLLDTGGDVVSGSLDNVSIDNSKISGMDASKLTGTVADARVSTLTASKLTGALPAISGANLTGIVAGPTVSASDPTINTNPSGGVGTQWANSTSGEMYVCTDTTAGANIWTNVGAGSGNISPNDPPTNPTDDFPDTPGQSKTINHTFSGSTDPDGTVTYYKVDNISNSSLAVNTAEVAAGTAHVFTTGAVASDTAVTFRVRAKDNYGDYSSGTNVATEIQSYRYGGSNYGYHMHSWGGDDIEKYSYSSDGNSTFVGDQLAFNSGFTHSGTQGTTHGYCIGGANWPPTSNINRIEKVSFSVDGNAVDVGDLTVARHGQTGNTHGAKTYGYAAGGHNGSSTVNTIDKWSQVSDANATDVGDAISSAYHHGDWDSETYGYIIGDSGSSNVIQKFSFASDGNATDVADLTTGGPVEGTNDVNTAFASRSNGSIDKFSFSTEANATASGFTLTTGRGHGSASSSTTHGYVAGGSNTNIISKYSFAATSGTDSDVGDLRFNASERCGGFQY